MDEFIRQAYADGMLNDDNHIAPSPMNHNSSLSSYNTTTTTTNYIPTPIDQPEEFILLSDEDDNSNPSSRIPIPPSSYDQASHLSSPLPPMIKVSLPYTYLSLIAHPTFSSNITHQDFLIKASFSSLHGNPRLVKNEFDLQVYVNDGSDCLLVRLASDLLTQRLGITGPELMAKRKECKSDFDKQKFQTDFNGRLKKFGYDMEHLYTTMTIRFFSDNQIPLIIKIDES
jgi:hypothetical protein